MPLVSGGTHICRKCTGSSALALILAVANAGAGAHPLGEARVEDAVVAFAVLVLESAGEHPGDDLHVAVAVGAEALAGGDDVVVVDQQQAVALVLGGVVGAEVERVLRVQPAGIGEEAVGGSLDGECCHDPPT